MSIGPVGSSDSIPGLHPPEKKTYAAASPNSESAPLRETGSEKQAAPTPPIPEDEVRVQWDTPMQDYLMIYQFVNQQSGDLILQMPDEQLLSLIHQIREMLQHTQQQAIAASSAPVKTG